ncbi:MAG: M3 family oligoendopeptidase [Crocinitomicaceae bacterium]|nr:M3 family oligoendopeptidase [Crocinitomicaceae bacterium]
MKIQKAARQFLPEDLAITDFGVLTPYFQALLERQITNLAEFDRWLLDRSELDAVLEEDLAWRYIRMSINTADTDLRAAYTAFVTQIQPELAPLEDQLNQKLMALPFLEERTDSAHQIYFRSVRTALDLYREENIAIEATLNEEAQQYGAISAAQSIEHNGENLTLQQAALLLKDQDETLRKSIFDKMAEVRRKDRAALDALYSSLIEKRQQLAANAGFDNYRDYKFVAMGRFDYTKADCYAFHEAIKTHIVPLVKEIQAQRLQKLGKTKFKPWDLDVDPEGKPALKPFKDGSEMLRGTIAMFERIDPYFGDCLRVMDELGHLDLDSKTGKAPGGYNYPLYEIGVPFIFMNAVGTQRDLETMVHEGGHAIHSFLSRDLSLTAFKNLPSEVAELASMSMELLSMPQWSEFYDEAAHKRAMREQLEGTLKVLPWIAQIDAFQHWIYENPTHSLADRAAHWQKLSTDFGTGLTDWAGYEDLVESAWQRQLHLFEVPFYYIEYGIAQLGALGVWKNSLENYPTAIANYKKALALGYTTSMSDIYETAGVPFDFSSERLQTLARFIQEQLKKMN